MNIFQKLFLVLLHIILGYISNSNQQLISSLFWVVFFIAVVHILLYKNKNGEAHYYSSYIVGIEVLLRMVKANVFWEFGKYGIIILLVIAMFIEKEKNTKPKIIYIYLLLLIPSILLNSSVDFSNWKNQISFNISGPLALAVSSLYFYRREFRKSDISKLFFFNVLPIISMIVVIYLRQQNTTIIFNNLSNFETSGGYGPNQVATIIGLGITSIGIAIFLKIPIILNQIFNYLLIIIFSVFGLLTFSRGGMVAAIISLALGWLFYYVKSKHQRIGAFFKGIIFVFLIIFSWFYIVDYTENLLVERYLSVINENGELDFTGRFKILKSEIEIFFDHFMFGVGVGESKLFHAKSTIGRQISTHTEYGRMLAEHGLLGLINIFILILFPIFTFSKLKNNDNRLFLIVFMILSNLTMFHSAMRIVMPCYIYGLSTIILLPDLKNKIKSNIFRI